MKKFLYWLPRIIITAYPTILIGEPIYSSLTGGEFNLEGFGIMILFTLIGAGLVALAWKWPKIGGFPIAIIGILTLIGASTSGIGVDWRGVLFGGLPLTLAGSMLLAEGFNFLNRPIIKK